MIPLMIAATFSVIAFSGIGVAAITGNLSITHSSLNPFSSFSNAPASGIIQAPAIPSEGHEGLTRNRGETLAEGKAVNFQYGARISGTQSCLPELWCRGFDPSRTFQTGRMGITHALAAGSEGEAILKVAVGNAVEEQVNRARLGFVVTVHMENGTVRTIYESERPPFDIGERVKLVNGSVIRLG